MKIVDMFGTYLKENSSVIICPVCGRKRNILDRYGDLRSVVHCRCKTGKQQTKFVFDIGGIYVYTDENGDQIIL